MRPILPLRFESIQTLRETATSSTFVATDHILGRNNVVVKAIRKGSFTGDFPGVVDTLCWYRGLRHPHIAEILDAGLTPKGDLFYVRDFGPSTQLFDKKDMELLNVLLGAVDFLHSMGRVHGSIKPSNVLASSKFVHLADPWMPQPRIGSSSEEDVRFSAPEVLKGYHHTIESDLYSIGALLFRFFSGRDLFDDADLESLRARYIWASPRPLASISYVSRTIADIVENLIHKDPTRRQPAFTALKNELRVRSAAAVQSPAIGMTEPIEKAEQFLQENADRLRILVVEAPVGFGKTRYIEELRHRMALRTPNFVFSVCPMLGRWPVVTVAQWLLAVFEQHCSSFEDPSVRRLQALVDRGLESVPEYSAEHITHDLVETIASIAQKNPVALIIEDVDRANNKVCRLIDSIVSRATRLNLCIVVTSRPGGIPPKTLHAFRDYVGSTLEHISLDALSDSDAESVASFLERDDDRRSMARQKAGGNPLFLEEYCKSERPGVPRVVRSTISKLMSALPKQSRRVAEVLSFFEEPVSLDVLRQITAIPEADLKQHLSNLRNLGLSDDRVIIRHNDSRAFLHSRISRSRKTELHARCYEHLKGFGTDMKNLARHAYLGSLYEVASEMYIELARAAIRSRDFMAAARFYEFVRQCRQLSSDVPGQTTEEIISLARCRGYLGDLPSARDALRPLVDMEAVRSDPELLSSVYAALASPFIEPSNVERVRLLKLAIACLAADSPTLVHRYGSLANALVLLGEIDAAEMALDKMVIKAKDDAALRQSAAPRTAILTYRGRFRQAADSLMHQDFRETIPSALKNNLAVCREQLGDIRGAREIQIEALREASSPALEIVCLGNLGSMETKLGNMREAQNLFEAAITKSVKVRRGNLVTYSPRSCYLDAAFHWIERGNYRNATNCIDMLNMPTDSGFRHEAFQFFLPRCELHLALGQFSAATMVLDKTREFGSCGGFFDIERLLLQARLRDPSEQLCVELRNALEVSKRLETRYQECRLLTALARNLSLLGGSDNARNIATVAVDLALRGGYRLLAVQAFLCRGLTWEDDAQKESDLIRCLQEASDMDLYPVLAECAFHIGCWRMSRRDYSSARDYLFKSVSVTSRMAEGLASTIRTQYLSLPRHKEARRMLAEATTKTRESISFLKEPLGKEELFFGGVYRLTSALASAPDSASIISVLINTIRQSIPQAGIVVLKDQGEIKLYPIDENSGEDMRQRAIVASRRSDTGIYFAHLGTRHGDGSTVWVPVPCRSLGAGIYLECLQSAATVDEQEIQFLTVSAAIVGAALDRKAEKGPHATADPTPEFYGIVGTSLPMKKVYAEIEVASRNSATVLIEGESGTGKELVAKAIHSKSLRADAPFVPVDCGALPEGLIEAELFGTKKGSYTGATEDRHGLFADADRGTIFLDEVANASPSLQVKLLRVLQEREIRRVGDTKGRRIDVRLVAATNCNLERLVEEGKFRQDLLFRLKVLHIRLPPLRERRDDIPLLATAFLNRLNALNHTKKNFGSGAASELLPHTYIGNVRELQNAIERSFYASDGHVISKIALHEPGETLADSDDEAEGWFRDLTEGRRNFWSSVRDRYKRRDISRERVLALLDLGLRSTRGNYKAVASRFKIQDADYRRFMDFLRRNDCLLDFRPYRRIERHT